MNTEITSTGNAGILITTSKQVIYIDPFFDCPGDGSSGGTSLLKADIILITHSHWDHFPWGLITEADGTTGAVVIGPETVIHRLEGKLPARQLVEMSPTMAQKNEFAHSCSHALGNVTVTAFRTFHSRDHNSYLIDIKGLKFFHDGDNEDTRRVDASLLGDVDALFICPWQGSGWVEFIERLGPKCWFAIHLTDEELDAHQAGEFFPSLCDHVPDGLVVLRPGMGFVLKK